METPNTLDVEKAFVQASRPAQTEDAKEAFQNWLSTYEAYVLEQAAKDLRKGERSYGANNAANWMNNRAKKIRKR